jgi:CheY-like chemotaxis protein
MCRTMSFQLMTSLSSAAPAPDSRRVFCVDDDPVAQRILTAALMRPGWGVECACSAEDALVRFAGDVRGFDVLVTDHMMPGMDGLELVRRLRDSGFRGAVVVVTAHAKAGLRDGYRALGVQHFLLKPIDLRVLRAAVDDVRSAPADF